jgi:hypothetical protein
MSSSFECNICHCKFTRRKDSVNLFCPLCYSRDILLKSSDFLISTPLLKRLIVGELVLIAIVLAMVLLHQHEGPRISRVNFDKANHTISVIVKGSALNKVLDYSIDYGKTYQNNKTFSVQNPGSYIIVVRDDKNRKTVWGDPIVFAEGDFSNTEATNSILPPHITGIEPVNETEYGEDNGRIIIHIRGGKKPVKYSIDGGQSLSNDSVFNNLKPEKYNIFIIDDDSHIDTYFEPITIEKGDIPQPLHILNPPQSKSLIEDKLNRLFADPDNTGLNDSIVRYFSSQTMKVDCELTGVSSNNPYQLYQFLQRRFDGEPGTKRLKVLEVGYDGQNRINKLKIKEISISGN